MDRSWIWGFAFGVLGYWALQHFGGMGVTGKGKTAS
jgi:hypothetical protein